ncbi:MAG: flagellar hook-basal body complex protein, partial [Thiohalorhabdaceae bacterium]
MFQDMLAQAIGSSGALGSNQVGTGSQVGLVNPNFEQGSFSGTSQATDMAIDGQGFFITERDNGETTYTRAGNFSVDEDGFLVGPGGAKVQGWEATNQGGQTQIKGNVEDYQAINMQSVSSTAEATSNYKPRANLDADADAANPPQTLADSSGTPAFDYHFKSDVTVYDSQGGSHVVSRYYTKTGDNEWDVRTMAKAGEVDTTGLNTYDTDGDGTDDLAQLQTSNGNDGSHLSFDSDGALANERDGLGAGATAVSNVNF